jgi:hypothetical protein
MKPPRTRALDPVKHLRVDPARKNYKYEDTCGIFVRAFDEHGRAATVPIEEIDKPSLAQWLRESGPEATQDLVGVLLGHGQMRTDTHGFVVDEPEVDTRQKDAMQAQREMQVAFPPCWELLGGVVRMLLVDSYSGPLPPAHIECRIVDVMPDGRVVPLGTLSYRLFDAPEV